MESTQAKMHTSPQPNIRQTYLILNILYTCRSYFTYALLFIFGYARDFFGWILPRKRLTQNTGPCTEASEAAVEKYETGMEYTICEECMSKHVAVCCLLLTGLEKLVAELLGMGDAFTIGLIRNAEDIPAVLGNGCLLLSDRLSHTSIVLGDKLGKTTIRTFKHNDKYVTKLGKTTMRTFRQNDMRDLERKLKKAIIEGQPSRKPWKKILVIMEGRYILVEPRASRLSCHKCYIFY